jgi:hypothetical protein
VAGLDWGSVPAWIAAIITSGSFVVAAVTYRRSVLNEERDQASKVSAWASAPEEPNEKKYRESEAGDVYIVASLPVTLHVANRSDGPIYDIDLRILERESWRIDELPPGAAQKVAVPVEFRDRVQKAGEVPHRTSIAYELAKPELAFTDALGRRWQRTEDRQLRAVRLKHREIKWKP